MAALSQLPTLVPSHEPQAEPAAPMVNVGGRGTGLDVRKSQSRMAEAMPTLGSGLGAAVGSLTSGVTGPVGPVVGAGIGSAGGTALRSLMQGGSPDAAEVVTSGLTGSTLQAAGPVVGALGKGLYKGGVALLPKGIKQANPNIAATGWREGIALTRRGADKADDAVKASRATADGMIAAAQAGGAKPIQPMEVLRELRPVGQEVRTQAALGASDDMPALVQRARRFIDKGPVDLVHAQGMKRKAQDLATTAYKARDKGAVINSTEALTNEAQARGLRKALETRVPNLGAVNARTADLGGVREGAEHASQTGHILSRLGGAGLIGAIGSGGGALPAIAGAGAGLALTTPGGLTATGLALKPIAAHLPDAVRAAILLEMLSREGEDE